MLELDSILQSNRVLSFEALALIAGYLTSRLDGSLLEY